MADLSVSYMGLQLKNPVIAGASDLTANMDKIKQLADAGVGALVTKSLFEEEVQLERYKFEEDLEKHNERYAEMVTLFPKLEFAGPKEHLMWVRKTKEAVDIPVIASLNAVNHDTWISYAKQLEETGADALECNFYAIPEEMDKTGAEIEKEQVALVAEIKKEVKIPVSVKLSPTYANVLNVIAQMDQTGADAFVLFNRQFEPDMNIEKEDHTFPFNFSHSTDYRLPLRYVGLLHASIDADICGNSGIQCGESLVKMILAGAQTVQTVTAQYRGGMDSVQKMLKTLEDWMDQKGYADLEAFRGKLSKKNSNDPWAYTRSQYAKLLLQPEKIIENAPVM